MLITFLQTLNFIENCEGVRGDVPGVINLEARIPWFLVSHFF